jgi:hypothetical protein
VLAGAVLAKPGMLAWLQVAMQCCATLDSSHRSGALPPPPVATEALLVPTLLSHLLVTLPSRLAPEWQQAAPALNAALLAHPAVELDPHLKGGAASSAAASSGKPQISPSISSRSAAVCTCLGSLLAAKACGTAGVAAAVNALDAALPPLTTAAADSLADGSLDWSAPKPLCVVTSFQFERLQSSPGAVAKANTILGMLACFLPVQAYLVNDQGVAKGNLPPALPAVHAQKALPVLLRAVATGVTWVHSVGAASSHSWLAGQARSSDGCLRKARQAMQLLEAATRALCGLVGGLLCIEEGRVGVAAGASMHARWRGVACVLLAAYAALFWLAAHPAEVRTKAAEHGELCL